MKNQSGTLKVVWLGLLVFGLSNCTKARLSTKKQEFLARSEVFTNSESDHASTAFGLDGVSGTVNQDRDAGVAIKQGDGEQVQIPTDHSVGEGGGACARSNDPAIRAVVNAIQTRASAVDRGIASAGANGGSNYHSCAAVISKFVVRTVANSGETRVDTNNSDAWFGADCGVSQMNYIGTDGGGLEKFNYFNLNGDMYFCDSKSSEESCSPSSSSFIVGIQLSDESNSYNYKTDNFIRNIILAGGQRVATNPDCEQREASPLLLQLSDQEHGTQPIALSSRLEGVLFDILGLNSDPVAHAKKRISWLVPGSRDTNYFLVLPNARGQVNGIDELFGDNTLGPDGRFAANGYEALRKHETVHDGLIDAQDEVFTRLRLWHDLNGDGVAQTEELKTLGQKHVKAIDLDYDTNYQEVDSHGNKVKMKSVVIMDDDSLSLVFDIWFKIR